MSVSLYKNPPALDALLRQELFILPPPSRPVELRRWDHPGGPPLVTRRPAWWPPKDA